MKLFTCDTLPSYLCPQCCQVEIFLAFPAGPGEGCEPAAPVLRTWGGRNPRCPAAELAHTGLGCCHREQMGNGGTERKTCYMSHGKKELNSPPLVFSVFSFASRVILRGTEILKSRGPRGWSPPARCGICQTASAAGSDACSRCT